MAAFVYAVCSMMVEDEVSEDGDRGIVFAWYVLAEEVATGRRFGHDFVEVTRRDEAPANIVALCARIEAAGIDPRDRAHWSWHAPNYCSEEARDLEREEAHRERTEDAW